MAFYNFILQFLQFGFLAEVEYSRTSLASRPQVLENWPALGSRTALFFELLKFCGALEKFFGKRFFVEIAWKIFLKTSFFWRALALVSLALASRVSVLGKAVLGLGFFFVSLASSLVSSTSPLLFSFYNSYVFVFSLRLLALFYIQNRKCQEIGRVYRIIGNKPQTWHLFIPKNFSAPSLLSIELIRKFFII